MIDPANLSPEPAYEDVLVQAIGLLEQDEAAMERFLEAHSSHAARVREHLSRLHDLGFTGPVPAAPAPERIGDYHIVRRLGGGGMGVVYLARQQSLGRDVALKLIRLDHVHLPGVRERFRREVATIARLQHPGIVPLYDAGEDGGIPWLAMEHIHGASLDAVIRLLNGRAPESLHGGDLWAAVQATVPAAAAVSPPPGSPFAAAWVTACLQLVRAVALALQHAHERGVLHRDLKPSNVMLTPEGRAMLLDFGLAVAAGDERLTRSGSQLGTLAYMAPEQVRGEHAAIDARSDVYALAVTAWELLTLQAPFAAASEAATRELVLAGRLTPLREHNRAVPRDVEVVLRKACDVDPARRYASAAEFAADLDNLLELRPIRALPPGPWLLVRRWAQRHPARAIAIAAAVLLCLVAPSVFLLQAQAANRDIQRALDTANDQRRLADLQRDMAREAVDSLLARVAKEVLFDVPKMQRVRRDLMERAISFYERFLVAAPDDLAMLEKTARATLQMIFVEGSLGQFALAMANADRAVELATQLAERRAGDDDLALLAADALLSRGRVRLTKLEVEGAQRDLDAAAVITRDVLARQPGHALAIVRQLGVERGTSLVLRQLGRHDEFEACLQRIAVLWRDHGAATVGHEDRDAAVDFVLCSGEDEVRFLIEERRFDEARAACDRALAIAAEVAGQPKVVSARVAQAVLAVLHAQLDATDFASQERAMLDGIEQMQAILDQHPEQANALRMRSNLENSVGLLCARQGDRDAEATQWFERTLATQRLLVAADASVLDNRAHLAASLVNLGSQAQDAGEPRRALPMFEEAERLAAEVVAAAPRHETWQLYLYNATWFLAQTCGELGDHGGEAAAARRLAALRPDDGKTQRIAAELLAQASTLLARDAELAEADRGLQQEALLHEALQRLAAAAERGYADAERLRNGAKLAPLRALPGFAAVLQRVVENAGR